MALSPQNLAHTPQRRLASLTLQFCVFCIVAIFAFEAAARLLLPQQVTALREIVIPDGRYGFISKDALANRTGYINFRPSSTIRVVAYYPTDDGKLTLEYDCTYKSDRLGFVSNSVDYQAADILLLGDSNAQGDGGCEWVPRLDPSIRSRLYSTAVMGLGVLHWNHIVSDLTKLKRPNKILIVFIADDFFRTDWTYTAAQLECVEERGDCSSSFWYPISGNLAKIAAIRRAERTTPKTVGQFVKSNFIATYSVFKILKGTPPEEAALLRSSLAILSRLAQEYDLKLLWLNEKRDIDFSSDRARAVARGLSGLNVTKCKIPREGFMQRDAHPNTSGYDRLKTCVEQVIRTW